MRQRARGAFNTVAEEALPARELAERTGFRLLGIPRRAIQAWARTTTWLEKLRLARRSDPAWLDELVPMVASSQKARDELGWKPRCPTNVAVLERFDKVTPELADPRIALFLWSSAMAVERGVATPDLGGFDSRIHLKLDGKRGGDFTITVKDRRIKVAWGAPRPPTATIALETGTLFDLLAGRIDPASAQLTGKVRVQGEGHAGLVFGGMIAGFRAASRAKGTRGRAGRAMEWVFSK
jgi:putative sterol carrier protein